VNDFTNFCGVDTESAEVLIVAPREMIGGKIAPVVKEGIIVDKHHSRAPVVVRGFAVGGKGVEYRPVTYRACQFLFQVKKVPVFVVDLEVAVSVKNSDKGVPVSGFSVFGKIGNVGFHIDDLRVGEVKAENFLEVEKLVHNVLAADIAVFRKGLDVNVELLIRRVSHKEICDDNIFDERNNLGWEVNVVSNPYEGPFLVEGIAGKNNITFTVNDKQPVAVIPDNIADFHDKSPLCNTLCNAPSGFANLFCG
jgi:hypothetical protein